MMIKKGKKITVLGAGNVGATIAFTLTMDGLASEIVLIDVNKDKARGEALDIVQGTPFCSPVNIYAGDYSDAAGSDIVILTVGMPRKPGMTRIDLAKNNVELVKQIIPAVEKYAPDAIYIIVSNPVDILTYLVTKISNIPVNHIIGSGTLLDSARLRTALAKHVNLSTQNVHAYVFGEHGDTSLIPWSLSTIAGMEMPKYCEYICDEHNRCGKDELRDIENDVRKAGAQVIGLKGATFYAVALSVSRIVDSIYKDAESVLTISSLLTGQYGIDDICLSLPFVIGAQGIKRCITPPLTPEETALLVKSADALKAVRDDLGLQNL